jgi:AraC-like DNA-binding protein
VWHGGRRIRAQAGRYGAVLGPHEATRWSGRRGFEEITVEVDRHALEDCWRRLTGEDTTSPIPIHPTLPLDTEHGHLLLRIIRSMTTRLEFGPSLGGGASALEEFFLQTLLAPAAHHACQDPVALAPMGDAHLARRAEVFLEDEAHRAPTIAAVAEHHAVSIRTLQRAFLRHQGVTPRAFLRQVRFERARSRLQRGRDAHVTDVALSLGFTHLGRFSVEYRRRYGETPSATLHGHRAPDRSLDVALRIAAGDASASNGNGRGREGACGFCGCV